jgi:hypothetical protein
MNDQAHESTRVRVMQRIEVCEQGSTVTADPGVFDAFFLIDMLGRERYMQAYADGHLVMMHEG